MMKHSLLKFAPALALAALASCGASNHAANETQGGSAVDNATLTKFDLTSSAFQDGGAIPAQFTCDGTGQSPPLAWGEPPPGTKSFALVVDDPDAPSGTFRHWGAFDIPANTRSIAAGQSVGAQAVSDFDTAGYGGPCPPKGHGPHHYRFKLMALDIDRLGLQADAKVGDLERAAEKHLVGRAQLTGTYERR
jgi:Raf kinase inhibitor-like YbhB/YbcL family protein